MANNEFSTLCVFLRGVMPTGKNRVPMAQLREILSEAGFMNVKTWIQSGNVVLDTALPLKVVERKVHNLIKENIGADLAIVARTNKQLQHMLDNIPFGNGYDLSRIFFTLFAEKPSSDKAAELMNIDFKEERLIVDGDKAYSYIPGNAARSKLSNNMLEKRLGIAATTRNFNTMSKMVELSSR